MCGKMLDFGCGSKPYMSLFNNVEEYIGMDIEDQRHGFNEKTVDVFYDGQTIPQQDEYFDSIFSSEVYEHVPNLEHILSELNRVLKMGGYMLVSVPFVWNEHGAPYDFYRFTSYGIKAKLEMCGFEVIETTKSNNFLELLGQLWMEYIRGCYERIRIGIIRKVIRLLLVVPVVFLGSLFSVILPSNNTLYGDNIVLCKKVKKSRGIE